MNTGKFCLKSFLKSSDRRLIYLSQESNIIRNAEARIPAKHIYYEIRNSATESQDSQSFWAIPKGARISS